MSRVDTRYFDERLARDCVNGHCHHFAVALHRLTGWPIGVLWDDPLDDGFDLRGPILLHVYCVAPGGRAVDVEGAHDPKDLPGAYNSHKKPRFEEMDEARLRWFCEPWQDHDVLAPMFSDLSLERAEAMVRESGPFRALLEDLGHARQEPTPPAR